jgi:hypothetical protein
VADRRTRFLDRFGFLHPLAPSQQVLLGPNALMLYLWCRAVDCLQLVPVCALRSLLFSRFLVRSFPALPDGACENVTFFDWGKRCSRVLDTVFSPEELRGLVS